MTEVSGTTQADAGATSAATAARDTANDAGVPAWLALVGGLFFGALGCALLLRFALGWGAPMGGDAAGGPPGDSGGGPPPASVNTGVVELKTLRERVSLVGRLEEAVSYTHLTLPTTPYV